MALNALKNTADIILDVLKYFKIKKKILDFEIFLQIRCASPPLTFLMKITRLIYKSCR